MPERSAAPVSLDAETIVAAHAAVVRDCEPWIRSLEEALSRAQSVARALEAIPVDERTPHSAQVNRDLQSLLEAARSFQRALEDAVRMLTEGATASGAGAEEAKQRS